MPAWKGTSTEPAAGCQDAEMAWRSFVALGDSFSEGLDDPYPTGGGYRGWADLVAARLATDEPGFGYANLAIRGRVFGEVVADQVPPARAMKPELISFAAGGNDALRRHFDAATLTREFDAVIAALRASGADVLLFRFADVSRRLPGRRMIRPRVDILNRAVEETAQRHGARLVDLWGDDEFANPRLWSPDRLHLSAAGHRRVAAHVLRALDLTGDPAWLGTVPPPARTSWVRARAGDAHWAAIHLAPWLRRRLTGRSSGDLRQPKRPELAPVTE
jgi:lysophospholipase L1-like esterase